MTRNTTIFMISLAGLAILLGYGKYALLPKYQVQTELPVAQAPVLPPQGSASENASSAANLNQLLSELSDDQKVAQLFAVPLSSLSATRSALASAYFASEPGFIQFGSTASPSGVLTSFSSRTTSALPVLDLHYALMASLSAKTATSSANLANQVVNDFQQGTTVVVLSRQIQPLQFAKLLAELTRLYQQDLVFKQLIDGKLLEIIKLKGAYH